MPDDQGPVGPSAIAVDDEIPLADGSKAPFSVPRELKAEELPDIVEQFVVGARNSLAAGASLCHVQFSNPTLSPAAASTMRREAVSRRCPLAAGTGTTQSACMKQLVSVAAQLAGCRCMRSAVQLIILRMC